MKKTGIFLTGGGGIGPFHIGFFKALEEEEINYDVVVGSSIGALIAGAATYLKADDMFKLWKALTLESVLNIDSNKVKGLNGAKKTFTLYKECFKECMKRDPKLLIDIDKIRRLLYEGLDGDKIRKSNIDFGITTTELPSLKKRNIFKDEMKGNPLEYILASLYLPIFSREKIINNKNYVDISRFRSYPINMLQEKNCNNLYVVNLELNNLKLLARQIKRQFYNGEVTLVDYDNKPSILDFSEEQALINYEEGYNTTRKVLKRK